jgi:hypothetical protein
MTSKLKNVSLNGMVGQIFTQNHPFLASPCSESGKKKGTATQAAGGFFWAPRYITEVKDIHSILESLCQPRHKTILPVESRTTRSSLFPVWNQEKDCCNRQEEKE